MANSKDAAAKTDETFDNARDFAQKGTDQLHQNVTQMKDVAANAASHIQDAAAKSSKGYSELCLKSVEVTRSNLNAHFDFLDSLFKAKSISQAFELQSSYAQQQIEAMSGQVKELSTIAQKAMTESSKPFQDFGNKTVRSAQSAR